MGTQGDLRAKRSWPLQADFAGIAVLVILVAVAAGAFVHVQSEADAKQAAVADATFAANRAANEIALGFETFRAVSASAAASPSVGQIFANPTACNLSYAPIAVFDTGHIDILRLDGSVVCSSLKQAHAAAYAGAAWLRATAPVVEAPMLDSADGNQVAVYVYPIPSLGFLAWFLDLKALGPKLASEYGSGVHQLEFMVTSSDGSAIVTRSLDSGTWTGARLQGTPFAQSGATPDRNDVTGRPRWYGQAVVTGSGWKVFVGADKAGALADAARLQNQQFEIVAVGLVAVLLGLAIVYRRVVRPIESLRASVRSSRGLESPNPVPTGGPAEVADLGEDINGLIASLKHEWAERESAQQNYLRLFEGSPLATVLFDASGKFLEANDAAALAFGYSRQELTELSIADLYAPRDAADEAEVAAAKVRPSNVRFGPIAVRKKDGALIRVLVTTYEVLYGGRPARVSMVEDVTQREKLERQLNQSQRLESLGQLAGGVAHDFNNLLGVIVNFALFAKEKVLASGNGSPSPGLQLAVKDIDRVVRAGESAAQLTHQLLAFARREVVRPQAIDVNAVVADLEPLVTRTLGEHIEFITSPGKDLWAALMDPGQLEQVLTNLLVNARDAMPQGGRLIVDCENVNVDEAYSAGRAGLKPGRYVRIRVTDTGTGMDAATLQRVFEPFFTTKPKGQGTGLGLATVYGIVNQAGGDVSIYSELGIGTRAHVLLPASDEAPKLVRMPDEPIDKSEVSSAGRPDPKTLLVVEDADDLREITDLILTRNGYQVITASTGPAALDVVKHHAGKIDLLLTDVVMPHMQGPELARRVTAMHPEIRVLFMSGYPQPMLDNGGILEEGILLIEKPFTEPVLLAKVEQALEAKVAVLT
jgi:PAS domain S-box-containing protein